MQILQVQVETGEMSSELLLRHTEPPELGGHGIHPVRRAQSSYRTSVLGKHRGDHGHFRGFHSYGKRPFPRRIHTRTREAGNS